MKSKYAALGRAMLSDSGVAILGFLIKSVFALAVTVVASRYFSVEDFGRWAFVFSLAMMIGVSELGVGQFTMTYYRKHPPEFAEFREMAANTIAVAMCASLVVALCGRYLVPTLDQGSRIDHIDLTLVAIASRIIVAPFAGFMSALERYHERKILESITYGLVFLSVLACVIANASLGTMLLTVNIAFCAGSALVILRAAKLGHPRFDPKSISVTRMRVTLVRSFPYFIDNLATIASYSGLVAATSMLVNDKELGRFALLHTLILMNLIQFLEVLLRTRQHKLINKGIYFSFLKFIIVIFAATFFFAATVGRVILSALFPNFDYSALELMAFAVFLLFEGIFLLCALTMQINSKMSRVLLLTSIGKAALYGFGILFASQYTTQASLQNLLILLICLSAACSAFATLRIQFAFRLE